MAACRSPKPLVGVRVPGGMPIFSVPGWCSGSTVDFDSISISSILIPGATITVDQFVVLCYSRRVERRSVYEAKDDRART